MNSTGIQQQINSDDQEYRNFWDKERVAKAAQRLTQVEATILR
jgi:hypothetical protein